MDTRTTILAVLALLGMFLGVRYYHGMDDHEELLLIAQDKARIWQNDGMGKLQFPQVQVEVLNPPYEGAILQLTGSVLEEAALQTIKDWLEQQEPTILPDEYVFDVKVQEMTSVPVTSKLGLELSDPGSFGVIDKQQGIDPTNPFAGLDSPGEGEPGANRYGMPTMAELEQEAKNYRSRTPSPFGNSGQAGGAPQPGGPGQQEQYPPSFPSYGR